MFIKLPTYTDSPESVVFTPTTSLQLYLEMTLHLSHTQQLLKSLTDDAKADPLKTKRRQQAIVICGFAVIGKLSFKAESKSQDGYRGYGVENMMSSFFTKESEWPNNYYEAIRKKLGERCMLAISLHRVIYNSLIEDGVDLVLVYPKQGSKMEWLDRIPRREIQVGDESSGEVYGMVENNWDKCIY